MQYKADDIIDYELDGKIRTGRIYAMSFNNIKNYYHIAGPHDHVKIYPNKIRGLIKEQYIKILTLEDLYI